MAGWKNKVLLGLLLALFFIVPMYASAAGTLTLPAGLKAVPAGAFYGDTSIVTAVLPEGIVSIGSGAFAGSSLREITLPSSLQSIADDAFEGAPLKTVHAEKGTYAYQWMRENGYIAEYRALLIGEQRFLWYYDDDDPDAGCWLDDEDRRNISDVRSMTAMLSNVIGPRGAYGPAGDGYKVSAKTNLSYSGIRSTIRKAFADTYDQDISVFFIATHGKSEGDGDLLTAFTGSITNTDQVNAYWQHRWLPFSTLASWLKTYVKGRIFIVLESCGSGSAIYAEGIEENAWIRRDADTSSKHAEMFVAKAVSAFSKADPGVSFIQEDEDGALRSNSTGDLRQPKFYVLAASRHQEQSYGMETREEESSYNFFTSWLIQGIGRKNRSPADTDGNNILSLYEMFAYIQQFDSITYGNKVYYQHVQYYPENSQSGLLKLVR